MKDISVKDLEKTAVRMRMKVIDMIYKAQSEHPGDSLSAADFVTACYFKYMNLDPKNPCWPEPASSPKPTWTPCKCYASKNGKPKCIYAHTIKGKCVSFMENQCGWHGAAPNQEQYEQAMAELEAQLNNETGRKRQ
ncbi:MAG: hypothetical protein HFI29_09415 [Lachnospiraceae bacterium]|nr:hypothetical protein [Lachnospiraceae bacterium]